MPKFNWFRLFNYDAFIALGIVSFEFTVSLGAIGDKTILVTQGNLTSILYDDVFLSIGLNDKNPFRLGERAIWKDDNNDVWLGIYDAN